MQSIINRIAASLMAMFVLAACGNVGGGDGGGGGGNGGPPLSVDANGLSTFNGTNLGSSLATLPIELLNSTEQESLIYMREEERLAQDVYAYLDSRWGSGLNVFGNISRSEASHTEAVRQLLLRYNLTDTAANLPAGHFANATLQALYKQLVATGTPGVVDALRVGAVIEEIDIRDLRAALVNVDNQDIRLVYENLLKGSRNHLRAFVRSLLQQGLSTCRRSWIRTTTTRSSVLRSSRAETLRRSPAGCLPCRGASADFLPASVSRYRVWLVAGG